MISTTFQVLLYYKYVTLNNPEQVRDEQRKLCESLGLKGRIIVAMEGINGTVEGSVAATEKYMHLMQQNVDFQNIHFKKSIGTGLAFPKLSVKVRPEIVTAGVIGLNPHEVSGKYISASELHTWFEQKKEFYIVDMRNDYEYISGFFENSVFSGMRNFYELSSILPRIKHLKNKTIVTVCTGGIRCEKASGFLLSNGFNDVYQLYDGIHTYLEQYPNEHFKGKLYVFDNRLTLGFNENDKKHQIVGRCMHCQQPSEKYVNCAYNMCHFHFISCDDCLDQETNLDFCNPDCKEIYLQKTGLHI